MGDTLKRTGTMATNTQTTSLLADPNWKLHAGWGVGTLGASFLLNSFAGLQAAYLTTVLGHDAEAIRPRLPRWPTRHLTPPRASANLIPT